jgi:hypothetical protein
MRRATLLILLFSGAVPAQVVIEGDVVRKSTGAPLAGVHVGGCVQSPMVDTDGGGHFRLSGQVSSLPSVCSLSAGGPGLLQRTKRLTIDSQSAHLTVRVEVMQTAVVTGRILDEYGWPLEANVAAVQYFDDNGVRRSRPPKSVQAGDLGQYRIGNLAPGRYYLLVRPRSEDYLPVWYPSASAAEDARPIDLADGQTAKIDIHLAPGGGVEVRGSVAPPAGFLVGQVQLTVTREDEWGRSGNPGARLAPDGSFTMRHVAPGKYAFTATTSWRGASNAPPAYLARRTIEIRDKNIEGVKLNVAPTVLRDLKGIIVGDASIKPDRVQIALSANGARLTAKVEPDGSFVIPGVWPGRYDANATASPGQVLSIRFGSQEVLRRLFDFDGTVAPLRVTVAGAPVKLTGTVMYPNNRPVAGAGIVFVPLGATYAPYPPGNPGLPPLAGTDQNGAIVFASLPPGAYRVYVMEDAAVVDQTMADADFVKSQEEALPPLTVLAGENPPLKLVLPSR